MKFTAVTVVCLATGVYSRLAEPPTRVFERDLATVSGVVTTAGNDIDNVDKAVQGFSGDSKPVEDAAQKLVSDLAEGQKKVEGSDVLSLGDAAALAPTVKDLQKKGQALADDLHSKKDAIEKAGLCDTTRKLVDNINTSSKSLISAVVSKVDPAAQELAKSLAQPLIDTLNKASDDFSESNCKNAGGSGGSGSSTGGASASTPASTGGSGGSGSSTGGATATGPAPTGGSGSKTSAAGSPTGAAPTGSATTPSQPTGTGAPTKATTTSPVITAGAAMMAPAGVLAVAVAALMV